MRKNCILCTPSETQPHEPCSVCRIATSLEEVRYIVVNVGNGIKINTSHISNKVSAGGILHVSAAIPNPLISLIKPMDSSFLLTEEKITSDVETDSTHRIIFQPRNGSFPHILPGTPITEALHVYTAADSLSNISTGGLLSSLTSLNSQKQMPLAQKSTSVQLFLNASLRF